MAGLPRSRVPPSPVETVESAVVLPHQHTPPKDDKDDKQPQPISPRLRALPPCLFAAIEPRRGLSKCRRGIQGYLAHKKLPPPRTSIWL